jgi:hypothetical protein
LFADRAIEEAGTFGVRGCTLPKSRPPGSFTETQMRSIEDILHFRPDISPFLVHLTRTREGHEADAVLRTILEERLLRPGPTLVSSARFGGYTLDIPRQEQERLFCALCFTETPLNEIHCLLEIRYRQVNLAPFGIVFLKERLQEHGVAPVIYINNEQGDQDPVIRALFSLRQSYQDAASLVLPLVSVFGKKVCPPGASSLPQGRLDWRWEREWRRPFAKGELCFDESDVFVGLCPHDRISDFESAFPPVRFVDPTRNMKWYATTLIEARQRLDLKYSVI